MADPVTNMLALPQAIRGLAGPVFQKELRVASRHRRHYCLRFVYVALLTLVTVEVWHVLAQMDAKGSAVVQAARLGTVGKSIIVTVVWFQFVTAQVLAAVLLSDAIGSEIRQRTLEGLLVTPLGAVHIVLGKLLSRLLQLVLVLAISLPVLTVVRVLGGVPWDYVVSGVCITLSAAVFAGSLSLFDSATHRNAFHSVLVVGLWYLVVWGILSLALTPLWRVSPISPVASWAWSLVNPVANLAGRTKAMLSGGTGSGLSLSLLLHCLTMLAAAAALLAWSVRRVRRISLVATRAGVDRVSPAVSLSPAGKPTAILYDQGTGQPIRRVAGAPIVWKELCTPLFRARRQTLFHILLWVAAGCFVLIAGFFFRPPMYGSFFFPILILQLLLVIRLTVAAAGSIAREKEARTWPILLTTPLDNGEIVKGKAVAGFRRGLPLLVPLAVLYLGAALPGPGPGLGRLGFLGAAAVGLAATIVFLLGVGLYLSTRARTTAGAIVGTLAACYGPKFAGCGLGGPWLFLAPDGPNLPGLGPLAGLLALTLAPPAVYAAIGLLCLRATTRRLRRNVFG
ncbi:MAG: ABC transporter permease subunit [Planctomycetes bacterium]|nr:ABC transporter permease subunit [Planctomycetota bacterium]